jgi:imidazolonepropionase-like amidohydrolase
MVRYGQTPMQAIQSATINAARLMDREAEFGSVVAGKAADLVAVAGDPLADIDVLQQIQGVVKDGALACETSFCHHGQP